MTALAPRLRWCHLHVLVTSMRTRVVGRGCLHYWRLFFRSLFRRPRLFPLAITLAIYGFHFRKVTEQIGRRDTFDGCCPE